MTVRVLHNLLWKSNYCGFLKNSSWLVVLLTFVGWKIITFVIVDREKKLSDVSRCTNSVGIDRVNKSKISSIIQWHNHAVDTTMEVKICFTLFYCWNFSAFHMLTTSSDFHQVHVLTKKKSIWNVAHFQIEQTVEWVAGKLDK